MSRMLLLSVFMMCTQQAWSWGELGHKTSAQIAWELLDLDTKQQISQILKDKTLSDSSTWADAARSKPEWKFTAGYHYEGIEDNINYLDQLSQMNPADQKIGDLIQALFVAEDLFQDTKATDADRENTLKFITHFIADIHQPMHTGRIEDKGGNNIKIKWMGLKSNLHQIWDSQIIYLGHEDFLKNNDLPTQVQNYSDYLLKKFHNLEVVPTASTVRYDGWVTESMLPRIDAYKYKNDDEKTYTARFLEFTDQRMYMAGVRIAETLYRMIHREKRSEPLETLKQQIIKVVGDFYQFVSVKPAKSTTQP